MSLLGCPLGKLGPLGPSWLLASAHNLGDGGWKGRFCGNLLCSLAFGAVLSIGECSVKSVIQFDSFSQFGKAGIFLYCSSRLLAKEPGNS